MKPRWRLVLAAPDFLLFENVNPANWFSREKYLLPRAKFESGVWYP